jgi:hypothetical protein
VSGKIKAGKVFGNDPNDTVDLIGNVLINGQPIMGTGIIIEGPIGVTGATV